MVRYNGIGAGVNMASQFRVRIAVKRGSRTSALENKKLIVLAPGECNANGRAYLAPVEHVRLALAASFTSQFLGVEGLTVHNGPLEALE